MLPFFFNHPMCIYLTAATSSIEVLSLTKERIWRNWVKRDETSSRNRGSSKWSKPIETAGYSWVASRCSSSRNESLAAFSQLWTAQAYRRQDSSSQQFCPWSEIKVRARSFNHAEFVHEKRSAVDAHNLARSSIYLSVGKHVWFQSPPDGICITYQTNN